MKQMKKMFAILLSMALSVGMTACGSNNAVETVANTEASTAEAATQIYTASAAGRNGDVTVEVTFDGSKIVNVSVTEQQETESIADVALEKIPEAIVTNQSILVDAVSGATLTSEAIITAVTSCIEQAGLPLSDYEVAVENKSGDNQTMNCDVVVVGAGNSGLVSAITAAEEGANVILVEKLGVTGGSAIFSSGMYFAVDSKYVEENAPDVNDNYDDALAFVMSIHDQSGLGTLNKEKMEKVLAQTGDTIDYLVSLGMTGEAKTWTETYGQWPIVQWTGKGAGMAASFTSIAQEAGVTILLNCPATELIQSDDGQITGVQCDYDGAPLTINSSKVILACGGFAQNEEMMSQYIADWTPMKMNNAASVGDTGDGIVMAQAVGAKLYDNYALMASTAPGTCTVDASFKANMTGTFSHTTKMAFNAEGLRYTNEKPAMSILAANAMLTDSSDAYYYLFDGSDEELLADLKTGMDMGEVYYGDTIDELAEALGINADTLQNTFDRYQGFCENGIDEDFGKDADALIAYSEDNGFYAVRYYPTLMGTYGGIATDDSFHVLNQDGAIIDNLFAVGEMTNRDFYNEIYVGSTSLGFGAVMGRMAALTAVEELSSSK